MKACRPWVARKVSVVGGNWPQATAWSKSCCTCDRQAARSASFFATTGASSSVNSHLWKNTSNLGGGAAGGAGGGGAGGAGGRAGAGGARGAGGRAGAGGAATGGGPR